MVSEILTFMKLTRWDMLGHTGMDLLISDILCVLL